MVPIYFLVKSCYRGSPDENRGILSSNWVKVALSVDGLICSILLIIGALSIVAALAHVNQLQFLANQYPVLSYTLICIPIAVALVDLALLLVKKAMASATNTAHTRDVDIERGDTPSVPEESSAEEDLFQPVYDTNPENYEQVMNDWVALPWFQQLDSGVQDNFEEVLTRIRDFDIPAQHVVFGTNATKDATYQFFKKSIIFLYDKIKDDQEKGELIVHQLSLIMRKDGSCPASFEDGFQRVLLFAMGKSDSIESAEQKCKTICRYLFAVLKREIVEKMASRYGDKGSHEANTILVLIGKERNIPGYGSTYDDMWAPQLNHDKVLKDFDSKLKPKTIKAWFYDKINGVSDKRKFYLQNEIPEYLAWHFDVDIDLVRAVIFDEGTYVMKREAINACLDLVGILKDPAATVKLETQLMQKLSKEKKHNPDKNEESWIYKTPVQTMPETIESKESSAQSSEIPTTLEETERTLSSQRFEDPVLPEITPESNQTDEKVDAPVVPSAGAVIEKEISQSDDGVPYSILENLALELVTREENSTILLERCGDILLSQPTCNLYLPDCNKTVREYVESLQKTSQPNMRPFAVYLWNGLAVRYPLSKPTPELKTTADFFAIFLRTPKKA